MRAVPEYVGPAWRIVTIESQWKRFVEDVPPGEPPVLSRGPLVEILRAWHGELAWEPERVLAPVAIMRGGWDGLATDSDARWLTSALARASEKRDIKIDRGTHLMHLETMRFALWQESVAFLLADQQLSHEVLKDQAEDLVHLWRGIIALHPHLSGYSKDLRTGEIDPLHRWGAHDGAYPGA